MIKVRFAPTAYLVAFAALSISMGIVTSDALAQRSSRTNDPGQIQRRIEERELPDKPKEPELPEVRTPTVAPVDKLEAVTFVLGGVTVDGSTVFAPADFVPFYQEFLAQEVTPAEIEEILKRITGFYRERGYFLSFAVAPPQELAAGILRIRIIEGYVETVSFQGASEDAGDLAAYVEKITQERPLTLATLERYVLLMNDLSGIRVSPSTRPVGDVLGRYELILDVAYDAVDGNAFLNNWGTASVGPFQTWLSGGVNSVFGRGERVELGVFTVPNQPKELLYGQLAYTQPIGHEGTTVSLSGSLSRIDEGHGSETNSTSGTFTARGWHPLIRSRDENLWLVGNFEFFNLHEDYSGQTTAKDRLRVLRARANYDRSDSLNGTTFLSVEFSQGLDILDASDKDSFELTRFKGRSDFTKVGVGASREQSLISDFGTQISFIGQKSMQRLLSYEEFSYGGSQFGRAYNFGQISGEDGVAASAELRYGRDLDKPWLQAFQFFVVYDVGAVWNDVPSGGTIRDSLASAGVGVRLTLTPDISGTLEAAKALKAFDGTKRVDDNRVSFSVNASF